MCGYCFILVLVLLPNILRKMFDFISQQYISVNVCFLLVGRVVELLYRKSLTIYLTTAYTTKAHSLVREYEFKKSRSGMVFNECDGSGGWLWCGWLVIIIMCNNTNMGLRQRLINEYAKRPGPVIIVIIIHRGNFQNSWKVQVQPVF